jgi:two-component system chemotaxis sensor kinase CheA
MKKYEGDLSFLTLFKTSVQGQLTRSTNLLLEMEKGGVHPEPLKTVRGEVHTLKGDSRMIGLESIGEAAHAIEDLLAGLETAAPDDAGRRIVRVFAVIDAITDAVGRLPEEMVEIDLTAPSPAPAAVEPGEQDGRKRPGRPAAKDKAGPEEKAAESEIISLHVRRIEDLIQKSSAFPQYFNKFSFILSQLEKFKTELEADPAAAEEAKRLGALLFQFAHELSFYDLGSRQFQNEITKLKLVPLSTIFDQFPRLVRDVAEHTGKKIALTVKGKEVELDKTIVERLKTLLIHLLRNAVDHGIEGAAERRAAGKPAEGRVVLHAYNRGDTVEVEVGDDGGGIDIALVRQKAVAQGLVPRDRAGELSEDEVISLIFLPGFSTREVGQFSGRGVGMDVVSQTVRDLNGQVTVKTMKGRGTTFTVSLPLISSFIPLTVFVIGDYLYSIPSSSIMSVTRVKAGDIRRLSEGRTAITVEGADITLVDLGAFFGFSEEEDAGNKNVIIVRHKDELAGFVVQEVIYEKKMIIRKLDWINRACGVIIGAVLSGRERAIPVLNIPELFKKLKETTDVVVKVKSRRAAKDFRFKNVLLVEDSTVSRTRQREILEGRDLNVFEAANGKEALALLEKQAFDVVVTDLEMPVMNGPDFIRRLRASEAHSGLPVIVMSSYTDRLEELKALGVNTFVDKSKFTARQLIRALGMEGIQ